MASRKPLFIDCAAGSELRDTQNEVLSVEGCDITALEQGTAKWTDNHGVGFFNNIGRITEGKKIFKAEDCENDRHRYYWDQIKAPYIYAAGYLYDDEDHHNAKAAAAILRNIHRSDCPLKMKASVEGGVIARDSKDPTRLARTKLSGVALTFCPANNATLVEPLSLDKSTVDFQSDLELIKSVMHLAQNNVPSFRHIHRDASATKVHKNLNKIFSLLKQETGLDYEIPSKDFFIENAVKNKIANNIGKIYEAVSDYRDELEKGKLKNALMGATMAAGSMVPKPIAEKPIKEVAVTQPNPVSNKAPKDHVKALQTLASSNPMLAAIAMTETSGAKNYNHRTIAEDAPMHGGHTAGGMFGMMPTTAAFMLKKNPELAKKYPNLVEAAKDIKNKHKVFTDTFNKDAGAAIDFAKALHDRNKKHTYDDAQLAYSWLNGLKGSHRAYKEKGADFINSHPYVKKVLENYNKLKSKSKTNMPMLKSNINKALVAGYGGASAPESRFGGAVLQSESMEGAPRGFKYVTCDSCGEEQIYGKHQIKCRSCNRAFSLEKLSKLFNK